jgi:hypothetical protein
MLETTNLNFGDTLAFRILSMKISNRSPTTRGEEAGKTKEQEQELDRFKDKAAQ